MNKELKVIQSNIAPLNTNHLWLNTDTNTIYKFGANGWEVIDNAPYIVEEFTINDIMTLSRKENPELTISRAFLDAMYKGVPIMVKKYPGHSATIPITVNQIENPSKHTIFEFIIKRYDIEFRVSCFQGKVTTGNKALPVAINTYNSIDWNENDKANPGYITNRTHYFKPKISCGIGNRISMSGKKGTHYLGNYKVLYEGELYDIPQMQAGETIDISGYFKLIYLGYTETSNTSTYTFTSEPLSSVLPSRTFGIVSNIENDGYKALDEFFLPDGAKPWRYIAATEHATNNAFIFKDINSADTANGDNVIRNKVIYNAEGKNPIIINTPSITTVLEFKIIAGGDQSISISGSHIWENGGKPDSSVIDMVIYSFLVLNGVTYASAKVYKTE